MFTRNPLLSTANMFSYKVQKLSVHIQNISMYDPHHTKRVLNLYAYNTDQDRPVQSIQSDPGPQHLHSESLTALGSDDKKERP